MNCISGDESLAYDPDSAERSPGEIAEMVGRMYECLDIQQAIDSGQFKSLEEVLEAVKARSAGIGATLREAGAFKGVRRLTASEFQEKVKEVDQHLVL